MKNIKSILIYGVLGLLCIAAVTGYFLTNGQTGKTAASKTDISANSTAASGTVDETIGTEATVQEATAQVATVQEATVQEATAQEATAQEAATQEATAQEATKQEATEQEASAQEATEQEVTEQEVTEQEAAAPKPTPKPADEGSLGDPNLDPHIRKVMEKSIEKPDPKPIVAIARGEDYAKATEDVINTAGGLKNIVKAGDTVLIKPNLCTFTPDKDPRTTDYETVQKVVDMLSELGASKIIVAEGTISGNCFAGAFLQSNKYDRIKGAELVNLNGFLKPDCYELKARNSMTKKPIFIPKIYMDADVVINVAKLKTHSVSTVSLSLKNAIGIPPGMIYGPSSKDRLHDLGVFQAVVDLNTIRKPDFSIIEGIIGGEGLGPLNNTPVKSNIMFAGKDPVALDMVASTFMGFRLDDVYMVKMAGDAGIGINDLKRIQVVGADLNAIKMKFKGPFE